MNKRFFLLSIVAVMFLLMTVSCGGGGASGGGVGGTGISAGQIQAFGSIFVNGVEWETESAEFEIEGSGGFSESDLQHGMLIQVEGTLDDSSTTGTADLVKFDDNLEGPITSITPSSTGLVKTLVVMGQIVIVEDGVTFFDNNDPTFTFATMAVGDVVEVSGSTNFDDSIRATFIEKKADDLATFLATDDLEVKGIVANLIVPDQFTINGLTVIYTGITPRNVPAGGFVDGLLVEVKGDAFDVATNTLTATDVEVKVAGLGADDIDKAEVEGFVTNLDTVAQTFKVNGQLVDYSAATFFGGTEAELLNGTKVEAEGPIVGGILQAEKVDFKAAFKFEANADTVNVGAGTLILDGLSGLTVLVDDALTEIEPAGSTLDDIVLGDELKIRAREGSGGTIVAIELEILDNPSDRAIIQGTVDSFVPLGDVTIIGVVVDTTTIQDDDFKDDDVSIGRTTFFNRLEVGDLVKARFDLSTVNWDQIEFED